MTGNSAACELGLKKHRSYRTVSDLSSLFNRDNEWRIICLVDEPVSQDMRFLLREVLYIIHQCIPFSRSSWMTMVYDEDDDAFRSQQFEQLFNG
jgi:hypothetical protein